jgi:hypothetical protein
MKVSTLRGNPWDKFEFNNIVYRDNNLQHVPAKPNFQDPNQKNIFLLGDSMVESVSTPVEKVFYSIVDSNHDNLSVVPFHFAGCSLQALVLYFNQYQAFFQKDNKVFKPNLAVFQIRPLSYQGGNTVLFDPRLGRPRDFQDPINLIKSDVVVEKEKFLSNFKLDIKFSPKFQDKLFRDLVLGETRIVSLLAWKFFQWTSRVTNQVPNHEELFVENKLEELYWQRFENSVRLLKASSIQNQIPVRVLLVPSPEWLERYSYTHEFNEQEKRYKNLFDKYGIPFHNSIIDFHLERQNAGNKLFFDDGHPNSYGVKALSNAFDKLLMEQDI